MGCASAKVDVLPFVKEKEEEQQEKAILENQREDQNTTHEKDDVKRVKQIKQRNDVIEPTTASPTSLLSKQEPDKQEQDTHDRFGSRLIVPLSIQTHDVSPRVDDREHRIAASPSAWLSSSQVSCASSRDCTGFKSGHTSARFFGSVLKTEALSARERKKDNNNNFLFDQQTQLPGFIN